MESEVKQPRKIWELIRQIKAHPKFYTLSDTAKAKIQKAFEMAPQNNAFLRRLWNYLYLGEGSPVEFLPYADCPTILAPVDFGPIPEEKINQVVEEVVEVKQLGVDVVLDKVGLDTIRVGTPPPPPPVLPPI